MAVRPSGRDALLWRCTEPNAIVIAFIGRQREAMMAQVIVRELEEVVKQGLKRRAARHGRSMEEEIREILRNAAREEPGSPTRLGSRIAARFRGKGLDADLIELRGTEARPADLEE
jgi:plasmid stability protein